MKKNVFVYALFALLLICVMVSCNSNTTKPQEVIAKSPATLKVNYFREFYAVGDKEDKLVGTLLYTAEGGSKIETIEISSAEVTKKGFDTTTTGEGKTLKLTYKGIDCVVAYNVVKQQTVDLCGEFIVADKTTLYFNKDGKTVDKETWNNWFDYFTFADPKEAETLDYTVGISSSGMTIVKVDGTNYYPDENGGLRSYPSSDQYFDSDDENIDATKFVPSKTYYYVSIAPEDHMIGTNDAAHDKYLVMAFEYEVVPEESYIAYIWFTTDTTSGTLTGLTKDTAIKVDGSKMTFGIGGVSMNKVDGTTESADEKVQKAMKNLTIILKHEGYDSKSKAFTFVSYSDSDLKYKGYSYIMKLSDTLIP